MPRHLVIGGHVVTTVEAVLERYAPRTATIPAARWVMVRPMAVEAVRAAKYKSVWGAHFALRNTALFLSWAVDQGLPLESEAVFTPDLVERFSALAAKNCSRRTVANYRSSLRAVARANTIKAPWAPEPKPYADHVHLAPPYTTDEIAAFWRCAENQATGYRTRVMTTMLTLGLGAGLRASEVMATSSEDHVRHHPADDRLWVIILDDRTVPVVSQYVPRLRSLCVAYPEGPLIGEHKITSKDPLGVVRRRLEIPDWLPRLSMSRLRTTWMATVLQQPDVRISEFMLMSGTVSSKTLECLAPFIPYRAAEDEYLFRGAGL